MTIGNSAALSKSGFILEERCRIKPKIKPNWYKIEHCIIRLDEY